MISLPAITPTAVKPPQISTSSSSTPHLIQHKQQPIDPTVLWTSSISRHSKNNHLHKAIAEYTRMRLAEVEPNNITFVTLLSSCATSKMHRIGSCIHGQVRKIGLDRNDVMVGTAVVAMYSKCGKLSLARSAFDEMSVRNSVSWNTMVDGCMRNGELDEAVQLFDLMPQRDAISWTALIGGFARSGFYDEALECFREMQMSGVQPDYVTVISVLAACANLGTLGLGLWIHRFVMTQDFMENVRVNNSLIDLYARCGCIDFAAQVFNGMSNRSLVSWNSIIVGFAVNGHAEEALELFYSMRKEGFEPDGVSFTGALTACSHAGLIDEGLKLFDQMKRVYRIVPRIEHYGCVVDIYSRAGRLEDAMNVVEKMPMKPNEVVLGSLLAACRTYDDVGLAERVMTYLVEMDPDSDSNYVLLSNIYAGVGKWDGANRIRRGMKDRGIQKRPGFSSVEIDCSIHEFVAGDRSHVHSDSIYAALEILCDELRLCGYLPETSLVESNQQD